MRVGVLGTGMVGQTIASKLVERGHEVTMGSRTKDNEKAVAWAEKAGSKATTGTFADAASGAELIFNCTLGAGSLDALKSAGAQNLVGKVLVDVSNPLDFSKGMPPSLLVANTDSLAEQIQRAFPKARVVKALNTMNAFLMVNPKLVPGDHDVFICGNDASAKSKVSKLLQDDFGWSAKNVMDLGDLGAARGLEMIIGVWLRLWGKFQHGNFNWHVTVGPAPPK